MEDAKSIQTLVDTSAKLIKEGMRIHLFISSYTSLLWVASSIYQLLPDHTLLMLSVMWLDFMQSLQLSIG